MSSKKLGLIDIGARDGALAKFAPHLEQLDLVLVEPEQTEYRRLLDASKQESLYRVIGTALGDVDGESILHETVNPYCSSLLRVNHDYLSAYSIQPHFAPKAATPIKTARYETLYRSRNLPIPHVIKVDVQGFEYQVLVGFGHLLNECLGIELETHFYQLYKNQMVLGDIIEFLGKYNFVLRRLSNQRSPQLNGDYHFDGDLVEVDAIFTKSRQWVMSRPAQSRARFEAASDILGVQCYALPAPAISAA